MMKFKQSQQNKPSNRGLILLGLLLCVSILPVALFRYGYKFNITSKELILLLFFDLLVVLFVSEKKTIVRVKSLHILLFFASLPVFLLNRESPHLLAILGLFLVLLLLLPEVISEDKIFSWLAWSAMIATILSFYQYWSTAYNVVPVWLEFEVPTTRMAGVLGQANLMACLIVVGLFSWLQVLWRKFAHSEWNWLYQIPIVIFFWALLLTGSKAGMLAFSSSLLLLVWGLSRSGNRTYIKFLVIQFSWSMALGLFLFLFLQPPGIEIENYRAVNFGGDSASTGARLIFGGSALSMGLDSLWSGVGLGGYRRLLGSYMVHVAEWMYIPYDSIGATLWAHNDFLHIFAECGLVVFLLFICTFGWIFYKMWPAKNLEGLFCFCAIWSFFIFMQFGHPFNDYVLVFYLTFLIVGALHLSHEEFSLKLKKRVIIILLIPCLFFINFYIISHSVDMYHLKLYMNSVSASHGLNATQLTELKVEHSYPELVKDPLRGWEFRYGHLRALGDYAVQNFDRDLANYLIPEFEAFQTEHDSSLLIYQLSRLYFMVGDYSACKITADRAYALKPDMNHYLNFSHICLVFDISRREKKPVNQLLSEKYFNELLENGVFKLDALDDNMCSL